MGQRRRTLVAGLLAAAACASFAADTAGAASAAPAAGTPLPVFNCEPVRGNLVRNGDAEEGSAARDPRRQAQVPGWRVSGGLTVARYGADPDFPALSSPGPAQRGRQFFIGGPTAGAREAIAVQRIDLGRFAPLIESGNAYLRLRACLGGSRQASDAAKVSVEFLNWKGDFFGVGQIGTVGRWERRERTAMLPRVLEGLVPPATVYVNVVIAMEPGVGSTFNLAVVDNIALTIADQRATAPAA